MSGCQFNRSVPVPVGTLSLTLAGLAAAGIAIMVTSPVIGVDGDDPPPSGGPIVASTAAVMFGGSSVGGGIASAGPVQYFSSFEPGEGCLFRV